MEYLVANLVAETHALRMEIDELRAERAVLQARLLDVGFGTPRRASGRSPRAARRRLPFGTVSLYYNPVKRIFEMFNVLQCFFIYFLLFFFDDFNERELTFPRTETFVISCRL